ncbi:TatD family hydrolase [Wolbachia endosymbiont of Howardula sp.]|uniref:TatD family hydrolase n=1 Tax=Wolbachia endosymbiont of Howardula sp. TaxID=2916816 RepID=UPI00217DEC07|nr:TatD family hydrolase [Wolbachia endosymbiont of Howardula sp.]UWI83315.1 TatD family hydrolase [Wolbachia endosymbiont of Howardula sp.]
MIIDSHCHLTDFSDSEISNIILRASQADIKILHNICVKLDDIPRLVDISSLYKQVFFSIGIHPLDSSIEEGICIQHSELIQLSKIQQVISIGETGLDFLKSNNKDNQEKSFLSHIEAARVSHLPLVIHTRNADESTIKILQSEMHKGEFSGLIHSFTSSKKLAYQLLDLGLYISFSGIITFKNASILRQIFKLIPRERVLIETDTPYLTPHPYRRQKNEPYMLKYIIECISELWSESFWNVADITTNNFFRLFNNVMVQKNS